MNGLDGFAQSSVQVILSADHTVGTNRPGRARERGRVKRQVRTCDACGLRGGCRAPVPAEGPDLARYVVVGEAPGMTEDDRGRPFIGPAGRLLKAMLREAGLEPDDGLYVNTVSCRPDKNRTPDVDEMRACRANLMEQVDLGYTPWVVLAGATALSAFRPDLRVTRVHGWGFVWRERFVVMPVYHPAAVLRDSTMRPTVIRELRAMREWMELGQPLGLLGVKCVECSDAVHAYDRDGVPYCRKHWPKGRERWTEARKMWTTERTEQLAF